MIMLKMTRNRHFLFSNKVSPDLGAGLTWIGAWFASVDLRKEADGLIASIDDLVAFDHPVVGNLDLHSDERPLSDFHVAADRDLIRDPGLREESCLLVNGDSGADTDIIFNHRTSADRAVVANRDVIIDADVILDADADAEFHAIANRDVVTNGSANGDGNARTVGVDVLFGVRHGELPSGLWCTIANLNKMLT